MVFYLKYRPQKISDLDSESLRKNLSLIFSSKDIPHAFLFAGPKGLGKTSTARILAKIVNCENHKNGEPCNNCSQCVSITNGSNIDVLEIDGASNRGIEEIRDLKEKIRVFPSVSKKKIYIIDEVHMLTTEAFNALLKIVEEPPSYVMFIFATTEIEKIPLTILSRCFVINFNKATAVEIVHSLKRIAESEKMEITDEALLEIANFSQGGFRDATKYLEEISIILKDKKIGVEDIENVFKTTGIRESAFNFLESLFKKDLKKSLEVIKNLSDQGGDAKYFGAILLDLISSCILSANGIIKSDLDLKFSTNEFYVLLEIFSDVVLKIKNAIYPFLLFEMGAMEFILMFESEFKLSLEKNEQRFGSEMAHGNRKTIEDLQKIEMKREIYLKLKGKVLDEKVALKSDIKLDQPSLSDQKDLLANLIYKIGNTNFSLAGVLRSFKNYELKDGQLILKTKFKFHKEKLEEPKNMGIVIQAIKEITGKNLKVLISLE